MNAHEMARRFNQPPPPNYVAGVGRGATPFTTRSDIGDAAAAVTAAAANAADVADDADGGGQGSGRRNHQDNGSLVAALPYDDDDRAADAVWDAVDAKMHERGRARRDAKEAEAASKQRAVRPKLQHQFTDLKRELSVVTDDQWANLPEPGDHRKSRAAEKRRETYSRAPDMLLDRVRKEAEVSTSIDPSLVGGPSGDGVVTDLKSIGEARGAALSVRLDQVSDSVTGQTVVDPKGYLTDLNSVKVSSEAEVGDVKKARLLLKSVTQTNPEHGPGWIAAARLEEVAGKLGVARQIIREGCAACPLSEDVWTEAARLQTPEQAKIVLASAVKKIPTSVKIWLHAASLETGVTMRRRVLRKALEVIPNSVKLWQVRCPRPCARPARLPRTYEQTLRAHRATVEV